MRAALLEEPNQPLVIEEVELDPPKAGEVLVKLHATGVCHSDLHVITGDLSRPFPVVLGHEGAGVIEQLGEGVGDLAVGDHVVLTYLPACGKCRWCHTGQPNMCDLGAMLRHGTMLDGSTRLHRSNGDDIYNFLFVGTWAEYTVCPAASVIKAPHYLDPGRVCLLGCGFTTGYGATINAVHIRPGESAMIVGCGGLGLAAVQGAKASGAGKIIAVDVHEEKLTMARDLGATHTLRFAKNTQDIIDQVRELTWGIGADYTFEFVGMEHSPDTLDMAFAALRKGGSMVVCGVGSPSIKHLPISPYMLTLWRKRVKGVLFGDAQFRYDIPRYMHMYESGALNLDGMVTEEFKLDDINTCVQNVFAGNKVARQVIRLV